MFRKELVRLEQNNLLRHLQTVESCSGAHIRVNGRDMLLFCSNDYLGLANDPEIGKAACASMERYGFGSGASRLVSGTSVLHQELERRIALFKDTEAALLFNSGYAANTGIIPAIAGKDDVILSDSLNHASIIDGCRLSNAEVLVYRHKDAGHVETLLKKNTTARRRLIVTDGVFSMDGDIAPLPDLVFLAEKYDALLMVDDAHATGVLGKTGKGTAEHFGISRGVHIQMGTLGKSFGSFGAYVAGTRDLIDYLLNCSRSFIFSTSLPPVVCAASIAAIDIVIKHPELRKSLWRQRDRFVAGLNYLGIGTGSSETPIVPVVIGDAEKAINAADQLFKRGIFATAIRPPTVPDDAALIRTTVTAAHIDSDIDHALHVFGELKQEGYL